MKKIALLSTLLFTFQAHAAFNCTVNVDRVLIYKDGSVKIRHDGRNDFMKICNLKDGWNGVDTVTCAMWTSMLQNLQRNNDKALFYYDGSGSCSTLATYDSSPAPRYIGAFN